MKASSAGEVPDVEIYYLHENKSFIHIHIHSAMIFLRILWTFETVFFHVQIAFMSDSMETLHIKHQRGHINFTLNY